MAEKPKVKIKGYEFDLADNELALVLALQELTIQLRRMVDKQ